MTLALLAIVVCVATGFALVCLAWPPRAITSDFLLKLSLSPAYGLGVYSCLFFFWLLLDVPKSALIASDIALCCLLLVCLRRNLHLRPRSSGLPKVAPQLRLGWIAYLAPLTFTMLLLAWLYGSARLLAANPHGLGSDAYAIWNLRSRFLFLGGGHWRDGFSAAIAWSHTDYPLLVAASIAHVWKYLGNDSVAVPSAVAFVFTFSTLGLLFAGLTALRGRTQAFLGGSALLGSTYFLACGLSQCADVPLGFFFLAGFTLLCLQEAVSEHHGRFLFLAGLAAGFAAWTKNEGLLFLAAMVVAQATAMLRQRSKKIMRQLGPFIAGAVPLLLVIAYFKMRVAGPSDLYSAPSAVLQGLADPSRYQLIAAASVRELLFSGHWLVVPAPVLATAYAFLLKNRADVLHNCAVLSCIFTFALMVTGYFGVYLISPHDLEWHLKYSLGRLVIQLWPSAIFLFFMIVRSPEEAYEAPQAERPISLPGPGREILVTSM